MVFSSSAMRATVEGSGEDLPLSHLPTACWVTPSFAASSAWLTPCFLRHCFNSSENDMVILLYIQRGILLMALLYNKKVFL